MKTLASSEGQVASLARKNVSYRKILTRVAITIMVLGLGLGLGLGFTIGRRSHSVDVSELPEPPYISPTPNMSTPLWTPKVNDTWQITLLQPPLLAADLKSTTPDVAIFDVDLFDTPLATIEALHNLGKKVICYFSAGSFEDWRPDAGSFRAADKGKELDGWPGETWLNINSESVRDIMKSRMQLASDKRCDGVDPDNVDAYDNDNGLDLTTDDAIALIEFLSSIARPLNLSLGLKNAERIIPAVLPLVDFSVNEECVQNDECEKFQVFIETAKPVLHIEYPNKDADSDSGVQTKLVNELCGKDGDTNISGFSTVLKRMNLDGWVEYCDLKVAITPLNVTTALKGGAV